jgi:hypothetical protein
MNRILAIILPLKTKPLAMFARTGRISAVLKFFQQINKLNCGKETPVAGLLIISFGFPVFSRFASRLSNRRRLRNIGFRSNRYA